MHLSYDTDESGEVPRLVHTLSSGGRIYFDLRRLDGHISKLSFYAALYTRIACAPPLGIALYNEQNQACPLDNHQYTLLFWESYRLVCGDELLCEIVAERRHHIKSGARTLTEHEFEERLCRPPKNPVTLPLGNGEEEWRRIEAFIKGQ